MPRSKDTKIWNEDLVLALRAREEQCRQRCSVRQYLWRDGAKVLAAVRRDIYQYKSNGKIIGLPSNDLNKTVDDECRAIIEGTKPILPVGYVPTTTMEEQIMASSSTSSTNYSSKNFRGKRFAATSSHPSLNRRGNFCDFTFFFFFFAIFPVIIGKSTR